MRREGKTIPISPEIAKMLQAAAEQDAMAQTRQARPPLPLAVQVVGELNNVRAQLEGGILEVEAAILSLREGTWKHYEVNGPEHVKAHNELEDYRTKLKAAHKEIASMQAQVTLIARPIFEKGIDELLVRARGRVKEVHDDDIEAARVKLEAFRTTAGKPIAEHVAEDDDLA